MLPFKLITKHLFNELKTDLPDFDIVEFFQVFGKKFEDNLSGEGKATYGMGLDQDVLTTLLKEIGEKLNPEYESILAVAFKKVNTTFDPKAVANFAQKELERKLDQIKPVLLEKLTSELTAKNQIFNNPVDRKVLDTTFNNYLNHISTNYKNNLEKINSIWSILAKYLLHIKNEERELKSKDPNAIFSIKEMDFDKFWIGFEPDLKRGFKLNKPNFSEIFLYKFAINEVGKKFHVTLQIPDRNGIIWDIAFQCRSQPIALFAILIFHFLAVIFNNDVERMVDAFKKIVKEDGIEIDPETITYSINQLNNNGKWIEIKKKGSLDPKHQTELNQANDGNKRKLVEENAFGKRAKADPDENTPPTPRLRC